MSFSLRRISALIRKESFQILRDPSSIAIAIIQPLFLLFIFGYGISLDATHVPIACVAETNSHEVRDFLSSFNESQYFSPIRYVSIFEAEQAIKKGEVMGIVWLRSDFERKVAANNGQILAILNGVDANTARLVEGYLTGLWGQWLARRSLMSEGAGKQLGLELIPRIWFNSEVKSRNYLLPGIIAVIMTLTGALLTAMVVAREWERGTMEALLSTPVTTFEVITGKVVPYFMLGMSGMGLSVIAARWLFEVPLVGSAWLLFVLSCLYMFATLGMGLVISTFARNQFVAGQIAIISTYMPAFMLSGFIFDIHSMPEPIKWITYLVPARYFVAILQTIFLAGDVYAVLLKNTLFMLMLAGLFFGLVVLNSRKRLD